MSIREKLKTLYQEVYERSKSVDRAMDETDSLIESNMIGQDDEMAGDMPVTWNVALKKQYVNFRNHLRRQLRRRYRG